MAKSRVANIRRLARQGKYTFSIHAERERQADQLSTDELEKALGSCELVEDYPDDPRGASCLVVGFAAGRPVHAVCALKQFPEEVFLITVYDPSRRPETWVDNSHRRREN
jgi:Domain of unknown function (DUF4258)